MSTSYTITIRDSRDGNVTANRRSAPVGATVTITITPDSGYVLENISVTDKNGNDLKLTDKGGGKYTFTMPASKVEIKATFMEDNSVLNFFYDVPNDAYYYEPSSGSAENGITGGVGSNLFAPNQLHPRSDRDFPLARGGFPRGELPDAVHGCGRGCILCRGGPLGGELRHRHRPDGDDLRHERRLHPRAGCGHDLRCAQAQGKGFTGAWMFHLPFTDVPNGRMNRWCGAT